MNTKKKLFRRRSRRPKNNRCSKKKIKKTRRYRKKSRKISKKTNKRVLKGGAAAPLPPLLRARAAAREKEEILNILRSGKVYGLYNKGLTEANVNVVQGSPHPADGTITINLEVQGIPISIPLQFNSLVWDSSNSEIYTLKYLEEYLPLVIKLMSKDRGEEFFSKVFSKIPDFNRAHDWLGKTLDDFTHETFNCGVVQSFFCGHEDKETFNLLESDDEVMNLSHWFVMWKGRLGIEGWELDEYIRLSTKLFWQIVSQVACLEKYGCYFFDIKCANILVNYREERAFLIDTGGIVYAPIVFNTKVRELEELAGPIKEVSDSFFANFYKRRLVEGRDKVTFWGWRDGLGRSVDDGDSKGFSSSFCPLFIEGDKDGAISPRNIKDGEAFNILAISLLAIEFVCLAGDTVNNFSGLLWRGLEDKRPPLSDTKVSEESAQLLSELSKYDQTSIFFILVDQFIKNRPLFLGQAEDYDSNILSICKLNPFGDERTALNFLDATSEYILRNNK